MTADDPTPPPLTPAEIYRAKARGWKIQAAAEREGYAGWDSAAIAAAYAFPLTRMQRVDGVTERYTAVGFRDPAESKVFVLSTYN